jgi:hypothetical protein
MRKVTENTVNRGRPKRAPDQNLTVHTTLRLPADMHQRLGGTNGDRGVAQEIRRRLEESFARDAHSEVATLTAPMEDAAAMVTEYFGNWRADPFAFQVLSAAAALIFEKSKPAGAAVAKFNPGSLADVMFGANDPPEKIGEMIGAMALRQSRAKEGMS